MTIETLEKYRGISSNIKAIQDEIESLYSPIASPNGKTDNTGYSGTPGNPTEQAVFRILKLKERIADSVTKQSELLEVIEDWIKEIENQVKATKKYHCAKEKNQESIGTGVIAGHSELRFMKELEKVINFSKMRCSF